MERCHSFSFLDSVLSLIGCVNQVKRKVSSDARYEAVGSSSLREELFATFLKAQTGQSPSSSNLAQDSSSVEPSRLEKTDLDREKLRREKKERAVREREAKVRLEKTRLEADIGRSKQGLNMEEGEREYRCAEQLLRCNNASTSLALTNTIDYIY